MLENFQLVKPHKDNPQEIERIVLKSSDDTVENRQLVESDA